MRFVLDSTDRYDKFVRIRDKKSYWMADVDTDDCPRDEVLAQTQIILNILNENADRIPTELPQEGCPECGEASASPPAEVYCVECATK